MKFLYNDDEYNVKIIKKNNKNLYIRVNEELEIIITCPMIYSDKTVRKLIKENEKQIVRMISLQLRKKKGKKETPNSYLGEVIDVVYCNVIKKPVLENEKLLVKDDKMLLKWYLVVAKEVFESRIQAIYDLFEEKIPYPKLKIRSMKTRWGVCNRRDNSVTLNLELIKKNQVFLDYVIVHELSHFVCFNHSPDFWKEVEKYCPNYKNIRKKLKE